MDFFVSISDQFFSVLAWGFRNGGWWFVVGGVSCILLFGLGIHRSPYR